MALRVLLIVGAVLVAACGTDGTGSEVSAPESGELTPVLPAPTTSPTSAAPTTSVQETTTDVITTTTAPPDTTTSTTTTISTQLLEGIGLELELIATFTNPVALEPRPGSDDLFVVEQRGRIIRLPGGTAEGADTTLDLRGTVSLGNEQGLLDMEFSADGGRLYVNFTDRSGATNIARYDMAGLAADPESVEILLTIPQPRGNHNGGQLAFGPDGYLYVGMGDGGGGGDPFDHGQNPNTLHGAILRIDVDTDEGYRIPPDNPFIDGDAPEVFTWGIRNAWRFGFDPVNGDLWIGDVGQDRFEEATVVRSADGGGNGANLGWNEAEGAEPYRGGTIPDGHVSPAIVYGHGGGRCSITGGEVYRGSGIPALAGTYLYGDFCTGEVFGYRVDGSAEPARLDLPAVDRLSSFGVDLAGEVYAVSRTGGVYRIEG